MKEKRNRRIELSREAIAVKKMREYRSLSLRDVGELLGVSFTTVSHMENGRARVHDEYLKKFLPALNFTSKDFKKFLETNEEFDSLKTKCFILIEKMEPEKLKKAFDMLSLFSIVMYFFMVSL